MEHQDNQAHQIKLPQERVRALREWLQQAPFRDLALLIASRALELKHEAAGHLVTFTATDDDSEHILAMEKADAARVCRECLDLLSEFASGKKRDTDEPVVYCEVVLKVTNTT